MGAESAGDNGNSKRLKDMPEKGAPDYDEMFKVKVKELSSTFAGSEDLWQAIYQDMKQTIKTTV